MTISAEGLRLALFTDTFAPQMNGVSRTLERLATTVRDRGGVVKTFTTTDPEATPDPSIERYASVPFWGYPQLRLAAPSASDVSRQLATFLPTLIHAATPFGVGLAGRSAARLFGVPLVTSYHTSFSAYAKYYHLGALSAPGWSYLRWFHNSGRRTYVPSHAIGNELERQGFERLAVWSRGVDPARFSPAFRSRAQRAAAGADDDTVVIGYVGRLALEKGVDVLLDAIPSVIQRATRPVRFVIVGDGPHEQACRARTLPCTTLLGRRTGRELSEVYASMDVFVFPSETDTFGNVLLEAAASRLAIVAADVGPTRELLGDDSGQLVSPANATALTDALLTLVHDDDARLALANHALALARRRSWDAVFDALVSDYQTVVDDAHCERLATSRSSEPRSNTPNYDAMAYAETAGASASTNGRPA